MWLAVVDFTSSATCASRMAAMTASSSCMAPVDDLSDDDCSAAANTLTRPAALGSRPERIPKRMLAVRRCKIKFKKQTHRCQNIEIQSGHFLWLPMSVFLAFQRFCYVWKTDAAPQDYGIHGQARAGQTCHILIVFLGEE